MRRQANQAERRQSHEVILRSPKKMSSRTPAPAPALGDFFQTLLDEVRAGFAWEADAKTSQFSSVGPSAVDILGYSIDEWLTEPDFWSAHCHPDDRGIIETARSGTSRGRNRVLEYRMIAKDGRVVWLRDWASLVQDADGPLKLRGLMLDISAEKRLASRLAAQYAVSIALSSSDTLKDAAPKILEGICRSLDCALASVWLLRPDDEALTLEVMWYAPGFDASSFEEICRNTSFSRGAGLPGRVWEFGRPAWILDVTTDMKFPRASVAAQVGLRGGVGFPILRGGQFVGVIEFFSRFTLRPDDELLDALAGVGRQIGQFAERKRAEEELRDSQSQLSDFIENAPTGLHWVGPDGAILWANQAELDLLGYSEDEYVGRHIAEFHVDQDVIQRILDRLLNGQDIHGVEARLRRRDGSIRHVLVDSNARVEDGKFVHSRCFTLDITERKRTEQLLRLSEQRYRDLIEALGVAVYTTDAAGRITLYNEAAATLWGRRPELGKDEWCGSFRLYWPEGRPMRHDECPMAITLKENRPVRGVEAVAERPDGSCVSFIPYPTPLRDEKGVLVGGVNVMVDITERKRAEQALREGDERLRLAMEAGRMGAWEWQMRTGAVRWSDGLEAIHGLAQGTFAGTFEAFLADVHPDDHDMLIAKIGEAQERGVHEVEYRITRPDGLVRWLAANGRVLLDSAGKPERLIGVCMDITERKRDEERLRRASEAKDEFLGLISHELRTPITTIYGGARLLRTRSADLDQESLSMVFTDIEGEAERLHRLVEDLLVLSRLELDQCVATEPVLLRHVAAKSADASRKRGRDVRVDVPADLPPVAAAPTYLEQVLRNLLSNGEKYSPAGQPIEITARRVQDNGVVIAVSDRGAGVPPEDAERIFERFYRSMHTAKHVGGAGIGLTVCKRLVEAQSGRIWAEPREGGGLTVNFTLPLFEEVGP
ncbi:MAG: PAS domain S-box protein [Dehalococcoidia bacterium]